MLLGEMSMFFPMHNVQYAFVLLDECVYYLQFLMFESTGNVVSEHFTAVTPYVK